MHLHAPHMCTTQFMHIEISIYLQMTQKVYMEISTQSFDDTAIQLFLRSLLYERIRWSINAIKLVRGGKIFPLYEICPLIY